MQPNQTSEAASSTRGGSRRWLKIILLATVVLTGLLAVLAASAYLWAHGRLRASLPRLEGELVLDGLREPVTIERDRLGIPTLRAANELDLATATGFLHAQERFFQMDLLRRTGAGELAELVGAVALRADRRLRRHRFRHRAATVLRDSPPQTREMLEAYARGVNEGLAALESEPFEYWVLFQDPEPWFAEDSILVTMAMFFDLQDEEGRYESALGLMHDLLPEPLFEFIEPRGTEWDAPVAGGAFRTPPIPGPEIVDIRSMEPWRSLHPEDQARLRAPRVPGPAFVSGEVDVSSVRGSNNWAVAGTHTTHGGALLANDMHLGLNVPNIWYRLSFTEPVSDRRVTGVTLPGAPGLVAGSNSDVAWGFTNSYGDWVDLVIVEVDPDDGERYITPEGPKEFERHQEIIRVKGGEDETLEVVETIWGPIVDEDHQGRRRALRWVAHDAEAVNLALPGMAVAGNVEQAIELANRTGIPAQNFVVADSSGRIGWTIMGIIPRRVGFDGRLPSSWADGSRRWDGWLAPEEYPRVIDPDSGRLWTANARVGGGSMLDKIGKAGYPLGARARQIRDGLVALDRASESDMLRIQLDDRALFLERWRDLLMAVLTPEAILGDPRRAELRKVVEQSWTGRASVDSAGYRLVRAFRAVLSGQVIDTILEPCSEADSRFRPGILWQEEGPVWKLVTERPLHLLHPRYQSWDDQLLAAVDEVLDALLDDGSALAGKIWGERNTLAMRHPLSRAIPWFGPRLDVAAVQLPGDSHMPRVQSPRFGASERMVVSPGREEQGLFHMPGGQSGHPLSPHYRDGHQAWVDGAPTPFLPGPAAHTLRLLPTPYGSTD